MLNQHHPLILFIIKKSHYADGDVQISSGLLNSAIFVVSMLAAEGNRVKLVQAIDGNSIDALVTAERPARVVLEAIWVTPDKLAQLKKLHPSIRWTVRVHSEFPFLANEGMAMEWLDAFTKMGVEVGFNSHISVDDFSAIGQSVWLPNYYPLRKPRSSKPHDSILDVGCFGAIRPLKNQLEQAIAAIRFSQERHRPLRFHINGGRVEQQGANNLKNIRAVMQASGSELVLHDWMPHEEFLELIAMMDVCLQVSLSESFCIVASDATSIGVPLVGSEAIRWLPRLSIADPSSSTSILQAMRRAGPITVELNQEALRDYLEDAVEAWNKWIAS